MTLIDTKFGYNDITIVPKSLVTVQSRSECNPFDKGSILPIFTAPMVSVVSKDNFREFKKNGIKPIMPRTEAFQTRIDLLNDGEWCAFSISETEKIADNFKSLVNRYKVYMCIDVANGHMSRLIDLSKHLKEIGSDLGIDVQIMTGNIANSRWFVSAASYIREKGWEAFPIDYIRCSIGSGNSCITSSNTGVHYPIASLIRECVEARDCIPINCAPVMSKVKIVADGGVRNYSDAIKALALGADYVMIGSLFAQTFEAAGRMTPTPASLSSSEASKRDYISQCKPYRDFYGMSTKRAQQEIGEKSVLKTSEGTTKVLPIRWTLKQWTDNFIDYLRSAMSYTDSRNLNEFRKSDVVVNSNNEVKSVNA